MLENLDKKKSYYKLKFGYFEIIKYLICRKWMNKKLKSKYYLYKKSKANLYVCLDMTEIIHKLDEFEKLKLVLLNHEKLQCFNLVRKIYVQ